MAINERTLQTLRGVLHQIQTNTADKECREAAQIIAAKDRVRERYVPVFSPENIDELDADTFKGFLLFKNNQHWSNLQRQSGSMTADMPRLQQALKLLVDEDLPIRTRLNRLRPPNGQPMIKGMARSVITAILQVMYPDKYGVLNNTAEQGMRKLSLWPEVKAAAGMAGRYEAVNGVLLEVATTLGVDLWTLDMLWWRLTGLGSPRFNSDAAKAQGPSSVQEIPPATSVAEEEVTFGLERHLHDFLVENWAATELGHQWDLLEEDGEIKGSEYNTGEVGYIDLLAKHKSENRWLVVELKRNQSSDDTVGQILRYMGWIRRNIVSEGGVVEGMIICQRVDKKLQYALDGQSDIRCMTYEVSFRLNADPGIG